MQRTFGWLPLVIVLWLLASCARQQPGAPGGTGQALPGKQKIIDQAFALLIQRDLERGFAYDHASYLPIRFQDGGQGVFVAIGFSGPVRGYAMVFDVRDGSIQLLDIRTAHADWGIWTLGAASGLERREADAELVHLVLDRQRGREELVRVTGYIHAGNQYDEEGYFELLRVSSRRIERLFAGRAREDITLSERGELTWRDHQYTFVNHDGTDEIRASVSRCQRVLDVDPEAKKCEPTYKQTYRFGAQFVLVE